MRRGFWALVFSGLLLLPGQQAAAAPSRQDVCAEYAARVALPSLMQSYLYSPQGYGPYGYAPLTYPFGVGPYGVAAYFGGPGVPVGAVPAYGPLGPGLTAANIARFVLEPARFAWADPANVGTLIALASLQQSELGNLNTRYTLSASYQEMASSWAAAYATQASAALAVARTLCEGLQPTPGGGSEAPAR